MQSRITQRMRIWIIIIGLIAIGMIAMYTNHEESDRFPENPPIEPSALYHQWDTRMSQTSDREIRSDFFHCQPNICMV